MKIGRAPNRLFSVRPYLVSNGGIASPLRNLRRISPLTAVAALAVPSPMPLPTAPTTVIPTMSARKRTARKMELRILFFMSVSMAYQPPNKVKAAQ